MDTGVVNWSVGIQGPQPEKLRLAGKDNYGLPRQRFAEDLHDADDEQFVTIASDRIWLSAYADNNPRSDYHWQADACYDEAMRRGNPNLYTVAYNKALKSAGF